MGPPGLGVRDPGSVSHEQDNPHAHGDCNYDSDSQVVCSSLSRSRRVTQIMSTEALLLNASLESFLPPMSW